MKKLIFTAILLTATLGAYAQKVTDLFTKTETKITYLGIDYSHVKLIGNFSQFAEAGVVGPILVKEKYFDSWNDLVVKEQEKYDIKGMFRKESIEYNISDIQKINKSASTEEMEADETPNYSQEDIQKIVSNYKFSTKDGIGIIFIAESLNKNKESGIFHFVAFNISTKEILLQESFTGKAGGIGLRNYWARSIFEVILQIKDKKFKEWKKEYVPK